MRLYFVCRHSLISLADRCAGIVTHHESTTIPGQPLATAAGEPKSAAAAAATPKDKTERKEKDKDELTFEMLAVHPIGIEFLKDQMSK